MRSMLSKKAAFFGLAGAIVLACSRNRAPAPPPSQETAEKTANTAVGAKTASGDNAGVGADGGVATPSLDSKESRAVMRTLAKVSKLRGLEAKRPVPGETLERSALTARVREKALREYPAEALRREGQVLELMGFAPPSFDYLGEMLKLLDAQLAGFYEPKNGTMYLAGDLDGTDAKATLAHELVHALQDQTWDLKSRSLYRPGRSDETMALACLAEGDATSSMFDFLMAPDRTALDLPDGVLRQTMLAGLAMGDVENVPHVLKTSLVAPYIEGTAFVHALRRKGRWPSVDRAWARVPTTTEQVLHVDKWEAAEPALVVPAPSGKALGDGFARVDEDTSGELGFALSFEEWMSPDDAKIAASGWGGDRSAVWAKGDELAYAVHLRYDASAKDKTPGSGDAYAERAMSKLTKALPRQLGKPALSTANVLCFERSATGPLAFLLRAGELVVVAGPAKTSPPPAGQGQAKTWTSTGTCATAKAWAEEIAAQR